jgi:hypothetical protein
MGAASVSFLGIDSLQDRERRGRQTMHRGEGRKRGPEESGGVLNRADYRRKATAGSLFSGERFLFAGGDVREGKRGKRGGEELGLYGEGFKEAGELLGGSNRRELPFPGGRGETVERMMLTGGSGLSAGRERKIRDTDSVSLTGRGWLLLLLGFGPWAGSSRARPSSCPSLLLFLFSSFSFSVFLFFHNFCNLAPN